MNTESKTKTIVSGLCALLLPLIMAIPPAEAQEGPHGILQATVVDRSDPSVVYTSGGGAMWRSTDSGNSWSIVQTGFNAWSIAFDNSDIVTDPAAVQMIYAATVSNGVMRSENGTAWSTGSGLSGSVHSVAVHPFEDTVYAGADDGIYVSTDRGMNWEVLSSDLGEGITQGLVVDPVNPLVIYAGKWGRGVYRSTDGGTTWQLSNSGLFDTQLFDLDLHPQNSSVLYAATPSGVFRSVDAGSNWLILTSPRRVSELAVDPQNPDRIIITTEGNGVARSSDGGETWTAINEGLGDVTHFVSVAIAPDGSDTLYAGSVNSGIFVSNDFGNSWSQTYVQPSGGVPPGPSTPPPGTSTPPPVSAPPTALRIQVIDRNGESVQLGERASFDIVVKNTGSYIAQNAQFGVAWEQIDHGGRSWTTSWSGGSCGSNNCNIGSLAPNQEVIIAFSGSTSSDWVGPFNLTVTTAADNAVSVTASAQVAVVRTIFSISSDSESGGGAAGPDLLLVLLVLMLRRLGDDLPDKDRQNRRRAKVAHVGGPDFPE